MKVLLVVIDAATPHVVCPAMTTGRLPVLQRLAQAGSTHGASVSIFPSITPAATASIITGAYPAEHGIAGASWYDEASRQVAYYGDDFWVIARQGFGRFLRDFLVGLNAGRLKAPTLFELLERTGRRAASINYLVFRGDTPHRVRVPRPLKLLAGGAATETVLGPSLLFLGDFAPVGRSKSQRRKPDGWLRRFGMDDACTGAMLGELAGAGALPDLTVAYFADNDYRSHEVGPYDALSVVEKVDRMLGDAFDAAGGMERALGDTCVIVTSDHGHCDVLPDAARAAVRLDRILGAFRQARMGRSWRPRDQIMICPNMRAAQIYVRGASAAMVERIVSAVVRDPRVDQAIWRSGLTSGGGGRGYMVASAAGRLEFQRGPGGPERGTDAFGTLWSWRGDLKALDADRDAGRIAFGAYPNAFERIAGALDADNSGEIWVTARPGCEFEVPGGKAHTGGASHGALHALDSLSPVIVAGGTQQVTLPASMRSVDIAPLAMQLLGVRMRYQLSDPR
jgi:hypothetical protein